MRSEWRQGRKGPPTLGQAALIGPGMVGRGGVVDPDALNDAVTAEVQHNLEKLERAGVDENHLFVWIDATRFAAERRCG
jgi:hypothetical protein